jgi:hypothetical protein
LAEKLAGASAFRLALSGAADDMQRAANLLDQRQLGEPTQRAEQSALVRLEQLLSALQPEEPRPASGQPGSQDGQPGGGDSRKSARLPPASELKLLKLMQEDINQRTRKLEEVYGGSTSLAEEARQEYASLSRQQEGLSAILVQLIAAAEAAQEEAGEPPADEPKEMLEEGDARP